MQKIEYIEISKLKVHPQNPRLIKNEQFKKLCESIKNNPDYFETRPILCNSEYIVFAGNMRFMAAKELKLEKVPCAVMDIPEERQKEIMIRDNVQNGDWNFDILGNNFEIEELKEWGLEEKLLIGIEENLLNQEKPEVEFTEELLEEHNYIVLYFDNPFDWQVAMEKFKLQQVKDLIPRKGQPIGIGRVIKGREWLDKINE